ncbi:GNAT family N-acetyltransferase [Streptomyces justiciae]|uniref:GNAT family N-acetyltransferase n=1 Tax=Streptomyces justiciae TaxID=2780140 RepID=UPI00187DE23B|nr:GNAT family N-acetyltransferase [Streptomyces justiciae]MBE8472745.1 GNAT family N-acetyltransferase [Streptomyces justiciae]MCW8379336.1 GNAT family N-acetyltransferase [Streptomyces justiciae]
METLRDILDAAARGVFPPADGRTTVVPQHSARDAGVLAFTAHSVVFTDEDPEWVHETLRGLDCDPLAATMNPRFLAAFLERTGRRAETIDTMLVGPPLPGEPPLALTEIEDADHPRIVYARGRRDDVRAWTAEGGVLVMGRGVGGRLEVSVEVDDGVRHRGLGRLLVGAARHLVAEPLWAQVAPGNARSTRAFQAAGYRPVGAEALLLSARPRSAGCSDSRS